MELRLPSAMRVTRDSRGGRSMWLVAAVALLGAVAFLNWGWLVAIGVAPVLLVVAPCAAMCAVGLCMNTMAGKSCAGASKDRGKPLESNAGSE